jgi:hypothetical protein
VCLSIYYIEWEERERDHKDVCTDRALLLSFLIWASMAALRCIASRSSAGFEDPQPMMEFKKLGWSSLRVGPCVAIMCFFL